MNVFYKEAFEFCNYDYLNFEKKRITTNVSPRFETITNDIQKFCDPNLGILDIFKSNNYNTNHDFLAFVLKHKGTVITTNFDLCIENAIDREINKIIFDIVDKDIVYNKQIGTLIKAHGCLSQKNNSNLISTIRLLAKTKNGFSNFPKWEKFLLESLENKTLLVLGYSGSDDFDIMPLLKKSSHTKCIWIDYNSSYNTPIAVEDKSSGIANKIVGINNCELYEGKYDNLLETICKCKLRSSKISVNRTLIDVFNTVFTSEESKILLANCLLFHHQFYEEVIINSEKLKKKSKPITLQTILSYYKLGNYQVIVENNNIVDILDSSEYNLETLHHISSSHYYLNNYTESKIINESLITLAAKSDNQRYLLEGLYLKGSILSNEEEIDEAATVYSEAFPLLLKYDDLEMEAKLYWAFGEIAQKRLEYETAYTNFKKAKEIYGNLNYNNVLPILDSNIAGSLADLANVEEALEILNSINIDAVTVLHFRVYIRFLKVQLLFCKGRVNEMMSNYAKLVDETNKCPGHPYYSKIHETATRIKEIPPSSKTLFEKFLY